MTDLDFDIEVPVQASGDSKTEPDAATATPVPTGGFRGPLFFDLETVPDSSREHLFDLPELPESPSDVTPDEEMLSADEFLSSTIKEMGQLVSAKTPSEEWLQAVEEAEKSGKNRKGVHDLLFTIRSRQQAYDKALADRIKVMSVTPEYCRIVALGYACGENGEPKSIIATDADEERQLLATFWELVAACQGNPILCGFNIINFDVPVILVRSSILGVEPTRLFDRRPWGDELLDLMQERFGRGKAMGMKPLASAYGLEVPAEGVDGSQVYDLYQAGKFDDIRQYVESDVSVTVELHRMWRHYFYR